MSRFLITPTLHTTLKRGAKFPAPDEFFIGDGTPAIAVHIGRQGSDKIDIYVIRRDGTFTQDVAKRGECGCE